MLCSESAKHGKCVAVAEPQSASNVRECGVTRQGRLHHLGLLPNLPGQLSSNSPNPSATAHSNPAPQAPCHESYRATPELPIASLFFCSKPPQPASSLVRYFYRYSLTKFPAIELNLGAKMEDNFDSVQWRDDDDDDDDSADDFAHHTSVAKKNAGLNGGSSSSAAEPQAGPNADPLDLAGVGRGVLETHVSDPQTEGDGTKDAYVSYLVTTNVIRTRVFGFRSLQWQKRER